MFRWSVFADVCKWYVAYLSAVDKHISAYTKPNTCFWNIVRFLFVMLNVIFIFQSFLYKYVWILK